MFFGLDVDLTFLESWLHRNVMYDYKNVKTFGFKFEKKVETCQNK